MQTLYIHPDDPQPRLINQVAEVLKQDKLVIYPTNNAYAFCCSLNSKNALSQLKQIMQLNDKHVFVLMCRSLSEIANYAIVDNNQYKTLKSTIPNQTTFILDSSKNVPKKLLHAKDKKIGIQVSDNVIINALLNVLDTPLVSCVLTLPNHDDISGDPFAIEEILGSQVELLINVGILTQQKDKIIDLTS